MRVPSCAIFVAIVVWSGCGDTLDGPGGSQPSAAETCARGKLAADFDATRARWGLIRPPAGDGGLQRKEPGVIDSVVDLCDPILSLSHNAGPGGGKTVPMGPSFLFRTVDSRSWAGNMIDVDGVIFRDIAAGRGVWVAVGGKGLGAPGAIVVADPAQAIVDRLGSNPWRKVFSDEQAAFRSVAFGAGTFVAVSTSGIAVSGNGTRWSWAPLPQLGQTQFMDVAFGHGRFVVAGVGATLSSADGKTWEKMACRDDGGCSALQQVTFVGDRFYLFGGSGGLESHDGRTLTRVPVTLAAAAVGGVLVSAALDPEEAWVRAGTVGELWTEIFLSSDEGRTWTTQPMNHLPDADCTVDACAVIPSGILVVRAL